MRIENECTKGVAFEALLFNSRLKLYKQYIRYALEKGYDVIPLEKFYELPDKSGRHMIIRHDVDRAGIFARKMFEVEKDLGIKSTYYFRMSTIDKPLIDEMVAAGFEVGFHFETIANYVIETGANSMEQIDIALMRERFLRELNQFEQITGVKSKSICSHGAAENRMLKTSNNIIFRGFDLSSIGIEFEAYDPEMYAKYIDCHIMDGSLLIHFGFAYTDTPFTAVN